jgi:hypothetical protein
LDLLLLVAGVVTGGPVAEGVRAILVVVAVVLGGLLVFVAGVFTVALIDQRKPPYEF